MDHHSSPLPRHIKPCHLPGRHPAGSTQTNQRPPHYGHSHIRETFSDRAIRNINKCRIYLRAETVSDITDASGLSLTPCAICCTASRHGTRMIWPRQPRPDNISSWTAFLSYICNGTTPILALPLGDWLENPLYRKWNTYYDPTSHSVISHHTNI